MANSVKTLSENFPWPFLHQNASDDSETPSNASEYWSDSTIPQLTEQTTVLPTTGEEGEENGEQFVQARKNSVVGEDFLREIREESGEAGIYSPAKFLTDIDKSEEYYKDYLILLEQIEHFKENNDISGLRARLPGAAMSNDNIYNVTFTIQIPNTNKYHRIELTNSSMYQAEQVSQMIHAYLRKKPKKTLSSTKRNIDLKKVTRSLADVSSSERKIEETRESTLHKSAKDTLDTAEKAETFYTNIFTPEGHNNFLKSFTSKSVYGESYAKTTPSFNNSSAFLRNENGHHAEIATDYRSNHDGESFYSQQSNWSKDKTKEELDFKQNNPNDYRNGTVPNQFNNQDRTNLAPQTRSKRPILNVPDTRRNTKFYSLLTEKSTLPSLLLTNSSETKNNNETITSNKDVTDQLERGPKNKLEDASELLDAQDWFAFSKLISNVEGSLPDSNLEIQPNNTSNNPKQPVTDSQDIIRAANLLIVMHNRLENEKRLITEQYKNHIKEQLGGESVLFGQDKSGSVMKINKEDNFIEGVRGLMLEYFKSLNLYTKESNADPLLASLLESVKSSTNIFELMDSSSQFVKENLKSKLEVKQNVKPNVKPLELTEFVKTIVEKQFEKCNSKIFKLTRIQSQDNKSVSVSPTEIKVDPMKINNKRLMMFTKCMNFKLQKCVRGFSFWLEKGKYHMRKQFKLERAYEHYEAERNLYCLRTYTMSPLGSTPVASRVKPPVKVQRRKGGKARKNRPNGVRTPNNRKRKLQTVRGKPNKENNLKTKQYSDSQITQN